MHCRREMRVYRLLHRLLLIALAVHIIVSLVPLIAELRIMLREWQVLRGKSNVERLVLTLGGRLNSIFDYRFIDECQKKIPEDAEVLFIANKLTDVQMLNYYLYPRKTSIEEDVLGDGHWTVHYVTPASLGVNSIEGPETNAQHN